MSVRKALMTEPDRLRVARLLEAESRWPTEHGRQSCGLRRMLADAAVVPEDRIPTDVVTLHSRIRVKDLGLGHESILLLVEPGHALPSAGSISVLSPLGAALLGRRRGEEIAYRGPSGLRRLRIEDVLFQPEASRLRPGLTGPALTGSVSGGTNLGRLEEPTPGSEEQRT